METIVNQDANACALCGNWKEVQHPFCVDCISDLRKVTSRNHDRHSAPVTIDSTSGGVPAAFYVRGHVKCIVCANMSMRDHLFCEECNNIILTFSRAIGAWSEREVMHVMNGLRYVDTDTWEVFKTMSEMGLQKIVQAQLEEMHES